MAQYNIGTLRDKIFNNFEERGFVAVTREDSKFNGLGNKWCITCDGRNHLNGYSIEVRDVCRRNSTKLEDMSIDIKIDKWENSSGRTIAKERVKVSTSDKVIDNRISNIIAIYNTL